RSLKDLPPIPTFKRIKYKNSLYLQISAIYKNEGKLEGVYKIYKELFDNRL
ncbi:hypothetical protein QBC45DRAFT_286520, partial [Copromyces sp. CBS 386.78]